MYHTYKLFEHWVTTGHGCTPKIQQTLLEVYVKSFMVTQPKNVVCGNFYIYSTMFHTTIFHSVIRICYVKTFVVFMKPCKTFGKILRAPNFQGFQGFLLNLKIFVLESFVKSKAQEWCTASQLIYYHRQQVLLIIVHTLSHRSSCI